MTGSIGGHALIALSSALMTCQFFTATQGRVWVVRLMDREPIVFFSCLLGGVGCARAAGVVFLYAVPRARTRARRRARGCRVARARGPSAAAGARIGAAATEPLPRDAAAFPAGCPSSSRPSEKRSACRRRSSTAIRPSRPRGPPGRGRAAAALTPHLTIAAPGRPFLSGVLGGVCPSARSTPCPRRPRACVLKVVRGGARGCRTQLRPFRWDIRLRACAAPGSRERDFPRMRRLPVFGCTAH